MTHLSISSSANYADALNHLYDPDELRRSPLTRTFGVAGEFDAAASLQRILTDAIEALRPAADEPPSRAPGASTTR